VKKIKHTFKKGDRISNLFCPTDNPMEILDNPKIFATTFSSFILEFPKPETPQLGDVEIFPDSALATHESHGKG
jgi:hypothetical protein